MEHHNGSEHQAFVWQHLQYVTTFQGRSSCACPKSLHGRLDSRRSPSKMGAAASIPREQVMLHRRTLRVGVADRGVVCRGWLLPI
jgi:hypothetical protein